MVVFEPRKPEKRAEKPHQKPLASRLQELDIGVFTFGKTLEISELGKSAKKLKIGVDGRKGIYQFVCIGGGPRPLETRRRLEASGPCFDPLIRTQTK